MVHDVQQMIMGMRLFPAESMEMGWVGKIKVCLKIKF